jgi:hypothetical protein
VLHRCDRCVQLVDDIYIAVLGQYILYPKKHPLIPRGDNLSLECVVYCQLERTLTGCSNSWDSFPAPMSSVSDFVRYHSRHHHRYHSEKDLALAT